MNDIFQSIKVLNLAHRTDRLESFTNHALQLGFSFDRFKALHHIGPHQSFNFSMLAIIADFYHSGKSNVLIMEDDCRILDVKRIKKAYQQLPGDWDMLYLGANVIDFEPYSADLIRVTKAWTTHAVALTRNVAFEILTTYHNVSAQMFDNWLGEYIHPKFKCYMVKPIAAIQESGYSDIWRTEVDYKEVFRQTNKKIK